MTKLLWIVALVLILLRNDARADTNAYCDNLLSFVRHFKLRFSSIDAVQALYDRVCTPEPVTRDPGDTAATEATEWYVRLIAEVPAQGLSSQNAQLGQLADTQALSSQSLKALTPFGSRYVDVVFEAPDGLSGTYKSVFHTGKAQDSWRFTVRTHAPADALIVSWRGLYVLDAYLDDQGRTRYRETLQHTNPLLQRMQVIDESSGIAIPVTTDGTLNAIIIDMQGATSRTFRWELSQEAVETTPGSEHTTLQTSTVATETSEVFDLSAPPQFLP